MIPVIGEDPVVQLVRQLLARRGRILLDPQTLPDDPTGAQAGWFAPVVISQRKGGVGPYGWGRTPGGAAEDVLAQLPPLYDPDHMAGADFNAETQEEIAAVLDHPVFQKLIEGYGRQFRQEPSEVQRRELLARLVKDQVRRDRLAGTIETQSDLTGKGRLRSLVAAIDGLIEGSLNRLLELDLQENADPKT